jgi:hypothetical protein
MSGHENPRRRQCPITTRPAPRRLGLTGSSRSCWRRRPRRAGTRPWRRHTRREAGPFERGQADARTDLEQAHLRGRDPVLPVGCREGLKRELAREPDRRVEHGVGENLLAPLRAFEARPCEATLKKCIGSIGSNILHNWVPNWDAPGLPRHCPLDFPLDMSGQSKM